MNSLTYAINAITANTSKKNKILTELYWVGRHGKPLTEDGRKRALAELLDKGFIHQTAGGKYKLTALGVERFSRISSKKAALVERGVRVHAATEDTLSVWISVNIPAIHANKFPDSETYNKGDPPHITALYVGEVTPGVASQIEALVRKACRRVAPFPVTLDVASGLQEFPVKEGKTEKPTFIGVISPGMVRLNKVLRNQLLSENIAINSDYPDYHPHCTWAYVPVEITEDAQNKFERAMMTRLGGEVRFTASELLLFIGEKSKVIRFSPNFKG